MNAEVKIERRAWVALTITSLSLYMIVLDATAVNVAFPSVQRDLETTRSTLSWMISAYTITTASFLLFAGNLATRLGQRKVFTWSLLVFIIGSAIAGVAGSFEVLIVGRVVQGIGAAGVSPTSLALCLPLFPPQRRPTAIGIWGAMASAGAATGPTVGAFLVNASSWRAIFWVNVPIGLAAIVLTIRNVPETDAADRPKSRLDPLGIPIATAGIALLMLAIVQTEPWGISDIRVILLIAGGLALVPIAIQRSRTQPNPAINLGLFQIRAFRSAVLVYGFYGCGFLGGFLMTTIYLQDHWDYEVVRAGLALSPGPIIGTALGLYSGKIAERIGHKIPVTVGTGAMFLSYLFLYLTATDEPAYVTRYLPATIFLGIGIGLSFANLTGLALSEVGQAKYAIANATTRTVQQIANAFGVAVIITLLGTGTLVNADFRRGWAWVIAMFGAALVATVVLIPRRSEHMGRR